MSQMLKSSGAMAAATLASRVLGMVREMVYGWFMGIGPVADAFVMAFTIPNLFRRLLGEGALTAAFIPVFKEKERTAGAAEMWRAANATLSGLVLAAAAVIALVLAGVSLALAWGQFAPHTELMLRLLRWMFPYMLLVCLAATFMGMLNARGYFFIPALGASVLNVVMIAAVFWLAPRFGAELPQQIFALALGVLLAGVAQAAFQIPSLRREGWRFAWVNPVGDPTVKLVVQRMIPGTIGVASYQLNVLLTQGMAFWLGGGIVAMFQYAVRLMELPQGVIGASLATYLLPTLSGLAAEKKFDEFRAILRQGLMHLWFLNLLATVLLVLLAEPMVRLLFERGQFAADGATVPVAFALACLAPGLVMFSTVNVLARAFYALGDTSAPMRVSLFCMGLNVLLTLILLLLFQHGWKQGALGIANALSATANAALLAYALRRKLKFLGWRELRAVLASMLAAGAAAALVAWGGLRLWETHLGHATLGLRLGAVFVPALAATAIYFGLAWWLKVPAAVETARLLASRLRRR